MELNRKVRKDLNVTSCDNYSRNENTRHPKEHDSKEVLEELFFLDLKSVVYRRVKRFNIYIYIYKFIRTNSREVMLGHYNYYYIILTNY